MNEHQFNVPITLSILFGVYDNDLGYKVLHRIDSALIDYSVEHYMNIITHRRVSRYVTSS